MKSGAVSSGKNLQERFVASIYATHNRSPQIRSMSDQCLGALRAVASGLVVGAGATNLHPALTNLDLLPGPTIHVRASAEHLPFRDEVFDLGLTQEVLESDNCGIHLCDGCAALGRTL